MVRSFERRIRVCTVYVSQMIGNSGDLVESVLGTLCRISGTVLKNGSRTSAPGLVLGWIHKAPDNSPNGSPPCSSFSGRRILSWEASIEEHVNSNTL